MRASAVGSIGLAAGLVLGAAFAYGFARYSAQLSHGPQDPNAERNRHESLLRGHLGEPDDPAWSKGASRAFRDDLTLLGTIVPLKTAAVECRSKTCVADVEFATYAEARRLWRSVIAGPRPGYQMNCGSEIFLIPPTDPMVTYRAQAIFLCADNPRIGRVPAPSSGGDASTVSAQE
jgi:hypothetical protein